MTMINDFPPFTYTYVNEWYIYFPDSIHTQTANTFYNLCPGTYLVTVTDDIGCAITHSFTLQNPPPINYSIGIEESDMVFCDDPGTITLNASANQDANFLWFNSTTNSSVSFTPSQGVNSYWVEISDACDNLFEDEITISLSNLSTNASSSDDHGTCDGQAWASANGGITPYTYYWPGLNEFGATQDELCAGQYVVNISDAIGCSETREVDVELNVGVEEYIESNIMVYPNPSDDFLEVKFDHPDYQTGILELIDITGKTILYQKINRGSRTRINSLVPGAYILRISNKEIKIFSEKIVITE
jgi:hypothetical protein